MPNGFNRAIGTVEETGDKQHAAVSAPAGDAIAAASHNTTVRSAGIGSPV